MHITERFTLHNKARLLKQSRFFYTGIIKERGTKLWKTLYLKIQQKYILAKAVWKNIFPVKSEEELALLLLMPYEMAGETAHEWIGMAIFILFILHHLMNRRWTGNIRKGRYTPVRIIQTVLAFVLLVLMIGSMVSGILLSRHIFRGVNIAGAANLARNVHMICAYWGFVLMAVHLGIHWNMFIGMLQKSSPVIPGSFNSSGGWRVSWSRSIHKVSPS